MLTLEDSYHLTQLDVLVRELVADGAGLVTAARLTSAEMCRVVFDHLRTHQGVGGQHDDMTMLVGLLRQAEASALRSGS